MIPTRRCHFPEPTNTRLNFLATLLLMQGRHTKNLMNGTDILINLLSTTLLNINHKHPRIHLLKLHHLHKMKHQWSNNNNNHSRGSPVPEHECRYAPKNGSLPPSYPPILKDPQMSGPSNTAPITKALTTYGL
ncbi:hypothetical protein HanRHA438_Chr03g0128111 [Helianthus annuus]|nr:hypothetical protein HanRHA438_Chr03g0128111 [Helianthus annuus]